MQLHLDRATPAPRRHDVIDLVRRAQSGDDDAFAELYRQQVGRVHALCLRLAGDAVRAEELTQDVFIRAWQKLGTFRGESALTSWLHRIAVNIALTGHRSDGRRSAWLTVSDEVPEGEGDTTLPIPGADIDMERAIATLPPAARAVFVLHDIEGYRHDEIAQITGTAVGTSKAHLFRARRLLREALER